MRSRLDFSCQPAISYLSSSRYRLVTPSREKDYEAYDDPRDGDDPLDGLEGCRTEGDDHKVNDNQAGDNGSDDTALAPID